MASISEHWKVAYTYTSVRSIRHGAIGDARQGSPLFRHTLTHPALKSGVYRLKMMANINNITVFN